MGGILGGGAPSINTPDPQELLKAQGQARGDSFNPFGALQYSGKNRANQSMQLTPEIQNILDSMIGQFGESGDFVGQLQDRGMDRLNQQFDPQQQRLQNQLMQSGHASVGADLAPGAVSELDLFNTNRNDAMIDMLLRSEMQGQQMQGQQIGNMGQLAGLGYMGAQNVNPLDPMGAYNMNMTGQMANANLANQHQQGKNQLIGDLAGAGTMLYGGSQGWFKPNPVA